MPRQPRGRGLGPLAAETWRDIDETIAANPQIMGGLPVGRRVTEQPDREGYVWMMSAPSAWPDVKPDGQNGNPPWHRCHVVGYNAEERKIRTIFRDGTPWAYYDVPPDEWEALKRAPSTGRFINARLNQYSYSRESFRPPRPYRKWPR